MKKSITISNKLLVIDIIVVLLYLSIVLFSLYHAAINPENEAVLGAGLLSLYLYPLMIIPLALINLWYFVTFLLKNRPQGVVSTVCYISLVAWIILPYYFGIHLEGIINWFARLLGAE